MKKAIALLLCLSLAAALCPLSVSAGDVPAEIPSAFDLRSVDTDGDGIGDRCYVTPVKEQSPFGTCWGFAAVAAAEISILGSVYEYDPDAWRTLDLSEKQLVYFSHVALNDPDNPQNGEGALVTDVRSARAVYGSGASTFLATSTFAQGIGPSSENAEELGDLFRYRGKEQNTIRRWIQGSYQDFCYSDDDDWSIPEEYRFRRDYLLKESFLLPTPAQVNSEDEYVYSEEATLQIKLQLLQKRGVSVSFCADESDPDQELLEEGRYLNTKTWAHYTWDDGAPNHAVTLIGWDDSYPKENFVADHQPPADGAWLVKNSWGSGNESFPNRGDATWGIQVPLTDGKGNPVKDTDGNPVLTGSGYFWLSYYDQSLDSPESFVFEDAIAPEQVEQHDYMQTTAVMVLEKDAPAKMANVFTARCSQVLTGFSCMTEKENTRVTYEIYLLCDDYETPEDGLKVAEGEVTFPYGGYHKTSLSTDTDSIFLQKGQSYAVILTMTDADGKYLVNESVAFALPGDPGAQKAVINERESFLYADGAWTDYRTVTAPDPDSETSPYTSYDNFPIKGYYNPIVGDLYMHFSADREVALTGDAVQTGVILYFKGPREMELSHPEIEWTLLNGSGELAEMEILKGGSQAELTVRKAGTLYLGASVKGREDLGTAVLRMKVRSVIPKSAEAIPSVMEYEDMPLCPDLEVVSENGDPLYEGEDFVVGCRDNESCGLAIIDLFVNEESEEPFFSVPFVIVPQQAEITALDAADGQLRAELEDQWETGITGYEIEYRRSGSEDWTAGKLSGGETAWIADITEPGTYEVRARAFVDVSGASMRMEDGQTFFPGEYSETQTVTVE